MRRRFGFTLVELVTVMLIVGILAVSATAKLSTGDSTQQIYCREIATTISTVQSLNVNQGSATDIYFIAKGNEFGYCLEKECSDPTKWHGKTNLDKLKVSPSDIKFRFDGMGELEGDDKTLTLKDSNNVDVCTIKVTKIGGVS